MTRSTAVDPPEERPPTQFSRTWLALRVAGLRTLRTWQNFRHPLPHLSVVDAVEFPFRVSGSKTPLRRDAASEEAAMELGKIQNLRVAAKALDGRMIRAGEIFSFWRQVGRCGKSKGYVAGRQLQEGCLVRAIGGGICQLSNALYEAALASGSVEILERHPHTRIVPGSSAERGTDATVAWNHIDLRWRAKTDIRISVRLTSESLEVGIYLRAESPKSATLPDAKGHSGVPLRVLLDPAAHSCGACGKIDCSLHNRLQARRTTERAAALVDQLWPEFDDYLRQERGSDDLLLAPLVRMVPLLRGGRNPYAWNTEGWGEIHDVPWLTLRRGLKSRRLGAQGAERQRALLEACEAQAAAYGKMLGPEVTHLFVTLDLLPFLWREGHLGGRTYDVLMTRQPIEELQRRLDTALTRYPERRLLGDFRAPPSIADAERIALAGARRLVTPHSDVVANAPHRYPVSWRYPSPPIWKPGPALAFCGPTAARKGAYEVREAVRALDLPLVRIGSDLEGDDFWSGIDVQRPVESSLWLDGVSAVVQPSVVEDRPRRLLEAIAAGCPVIATRACGVTGMPGVRLVPEGDAEALIAAIQSTGNA